jgi:integrase
MKTMKEDDVTRFLNAAKKGNYYSLFHCYLYTGLRRSELLSVKWSDCDLLGMALSINRGMRVTKGKVIFKQPKTKSGRRLIDLSPDSCIVLREHRKAQDIVRQQLDLPLTSDDDLVFSHGDGSPLLPNTITHAWIKLVRRCDLDGIRLHDARHTHATLLHKAGVSPKVIQERLGHASYSTTMNLYAHVSPGMQKAAALAFDKVIKNSIPESDSLEIH